MPDLQHERAVAKGRAALDTPTAPDAQRFVNGVFVIRLLNEFSPDGTRGTNLVFGGTSEGCGAGLEKSEAQPAIAALLGPMDTLHSGRL
jgi:hypothetical protein